MNRRNLFKLGGAGLIATVLPVWLARAFAHREVGDLPELEDDLGRAIDRARLLGKPVIVFIVPRDDAAKWERGEVYGDLLHYGGDALAADLALVELVCAKSADLAERFPELDRSEEALAYMITRDTGIARIARIDVALSPRPTFAGAVQQEAVLASLRQWIAPFAAALHAAIARDAEMIAHRETVVRRSLDSLSIATADEAIARRSEMRLALVDKCAALFFAAAEASEEARSHWMPLLAQAARLRVWEAPPPGARWASTGGCGVEVEGGDGGVSMACGMALIPEGSKRLLYFFTQRR